MIVPRVCSAVNYTARPVACLPGYSAIKSFWVVVLLLVVPDAGAQTGGRFTRWMGEDAAALFTHVGPQIPFYLLGSAVILVPLSELDQGILNGVQATYTKTGYWPSFLNLSNELGGPKVTIPTVAVFAFSLATDNRKFQDAAFSSAQSLAFAGLMTIGLKTIIGRVRPLEKLGPHQFTPFSVTNSSFPSGHATAAFSIITPWVYYYPGPVTYSLFALGAGTAVARIAKDRHWPTDVIAGAAIGFATARWLSKRHIDEIERSNSAPPIESVPNVLLFQVSIPIN